MAVDHKTAASVAESFPWWPESVCDPIARGDVCVLGWDDPERILQTLAELRRADAPVFLTELLPDELPEATPADLRGFFVGRACFVPPLVEPSVNKAAPMERWLALRDPAERMETTPGTRLIDELVRAGVVEWLSAIPEALAIPVRSGVAGVFGLSGRPQTMLAFSAWAAALGVRFSCVGTLPGSPLRWLAHGLALPSESLPPAGKDESPLRALFGELRQQREGRGSQRGPQLSAPTNRAVVKALAGTPMCSLEAFAALPSPLREACEELSWWWRAACRRAQASAPRLERVCFDRGLLEEARSAGWMPARLDAPDQREETWVRWICRDLGAAPVDEEWRRQFAAWDESSRAWRLAVRAVAGCGWGGAARRPEFAQASAAGWVHRYFQRALGPLDENDRTMLEEALRMLPVSSKGDVDPDGLLRTQILGLLGRWREMKEVRTEPLHIARAAILCMETRYASLEKKTASQADRADLDALAAWLRKEVAEHPTQPGAMAMAILGLHGAEHGWSEAEIAAVFASAGRSVLSLSMLAAFAWLAGREEFGRHLLQERLSTQPANELDAWMLGVALSLYGSEMEGRLLLDRLEREHPEFFAESQPRKYCWFLTALAWAAIGDADRAGRFLAIALRLDRSAPLRRMHFARTRVASMAGG